MQIINNNIPGFPLPPLSSKRMWILKALFMGNIFDMLQLEIQNLMVALWHHSLRNQN